MCRSACWHMKKKAWFQTLSVTQNGSTAFRFIRLAVLPLFLFNQIIWTGVQTVPQLEKDFHSIFLGLDRKGWIAAVVGVVGMCVNCQNCEAVGKLFADLWKRLVFFHQVVNGFSISTSGSFPYFHDARKSTNNQPVYCQWHIPYRHNQPPCQNEKMCIRDRHHSGAA